MIAKTKTQTIHGDPHYRATLPAGCAVVLTPATNLPADSRIKWWVEAYTLPGGATCERLEAVKRGIGLGLIHDEIEIDPDDLDGFTRAYVEAALWSSVDEDDNPLDAQFDIGDIAPEALAQIAHDCAMFQYHYSEKWEACESLRGEWTIDERHRSRGRIDRGGRGGG